MFNRAQWNYIKDYYELTPRQLQITKMVCNGLDNFQIAEKCDITYNTARTHVAHICAKAVVYGRAELILRLIKIAKRAK